MSSSENDIEHSKAKEIERYMANHGGTLPNIPEIEQQTSKASKELLHVRPEERLVVAGSMLTLGVFAIDHARRGEWDIAKIEGEIVAGVAAIELRSELPKAGRAAKRVIYNAIDKIKPHK